MEATRPRQAGSGLSNSNVMPQIDAVLFDLDETMTDRSASEQ